ncbi:MAG TPA: hypothetical protein VEC18_01370 [Myxococcota bacterium]|nr:hypothetical protein [Myxococcota bacterium]
MRTTTSSPPRNAHAALPIGALLIGAMLLAPLDGAYAGDDEASREDPEKLKRQILASLDRPDLPPITPDSNEEKTSDGFHIGKKGPVRYEHTLQFGDDELSIKLYGPMVKKHPGLRFRVEGLHIGDVPVNIEGFGNTKQGGIRFSVRF